MTDDPNDIAPDGARSMALVRWLIVFIMAAIATLSVAYSFGLFPTGTASAASSTYYCPMHPEVVQDSPGECPICSMSLVLKKTGQSSQKKASTPPVSHAGHRHEPSDAYACPMHPEETGVDENARCPICKMKLEKRSPATGSAGAPSSASPASAPSPTTLPAGVPGLVPVELALDRVQLIGVRTAKATLEELVPELRTVGYLATDEARVARVHSRFPGWIERLSVSTTGEKVRSGQVLAALYNLDLVPAQQEFLAARRFGAAPSAIGTNAGTAPSSNPALSGLENDARTRLQLFGMSSGEIDAVASSGKPARTIAVTAPIGGHVLKKMAVKGAYVEPGTELFEIADLSRLWVLAEVYEHEIGRVRVGQNASVEVAAFAKDRFLAKVGFVYPTLDPQTRTLRVRLELENKDHKLYPAMFASVVLSLDPKKGVVIPTEALIETGGTAYVFVTSEPGRFEPRRVRPGQRAGGRVEIVEGVHEGETVVTTANFLIDSESRLRAALEGG